MAGLGQQIVDIVMAIGLMAVCTAIVGTPLALIKLSDKAQRKRRAIADYKGRLGRLLKARYGPKDRYSPAQVKAIMKEWGYSTPYDCYGLAMYCDYADFMAYHQAIGQACNYEAMRSEISHILFGADTTFTITDLLDTNVHEFNEAVNDGGHNSLTLGGEVDGFSNYDCGDIGGGFDGGDCGNPF